MTGSSVRPRRTKPSPWPQRSASTGTASAELGKPPEQPAECKLTLHAGERGTETEVDAVPERDVVEIRTIDVEDLRLAKSSRVAVGCGQTHDHLRTRRDGHAGDLDRLDRVPERRVRDGRVVPKEFLDRGRIFSGLARSASKASGLRSNATTLLPIRLVVVS